MTWPETIVVKSCHSVSKNRIDQTNPRTDVSPASLAAIDYAVDLGMPDKATILIVFLIDSIQYSIPALLIKRLHKDAVEKLTRVAPRVKQRLFATL